MNRMKTGCSSALMTAGTALALLVVRLALLLGMLAVCGCAPWDVHEVRDPLSPRTLIGMTAPDVVQCMGTEFSWRQTKPDEAVMMYARKDASVAARISAPVFGSLELGGGGGCAVTFDIQRGGQVRDVNFPQSYNDALLAEPYHACKPLIAECQNHPGSTGLPPGYDAFLYLAKTAKPAMDGGS